MKSNVTSKIDTSCPKEQRIKAYLESVQTPYLQEAEGITVKVSFADTNRTLQDCITRLIQRELEI